MAFLVIAYPELTKDDFGKIQSYRKDNDGLFFNLVEPHYTLVFAASDLSETEFVSEIKNKANGVSKIYFTIRCATINKDGFSDYFNTFLVPDEGYSQIIKLHDKLYSGKLKDNLRFDLDYVPHITIGNSKDKFLCKKMVDEWNQKEFSISGTISKLTVIKYADNLITKIEEIEL